MSNVPAGGVAEARHDDDMTHRVEEASTALLKIADAAALQFGHLSAEQLNWKPSTASWSVGQCFDHLATTQVLYFPQFQRLATGQLTPTAWERYSPFSPLFGRLLIKSLQPGNLRKTRTSSRSEPSTSDLDERTIERFAEHQRDLTRHLSALPTGLDPKKVIITSPLAGLITYSLDDCLSILVVHGQRHFGQAARVTAADGFPARGSGSLKGPTQPSSS